MPREAWPQIVALGVTWMAIPFVLFAIAQQWIDSSLAGMINAATPLFVALVAATAVRQLPSRLQVVGLLVGFAGVVAISLPSVGQRLERARRRRWCSAPRFLYGFAFNIAAPLQRQHGALPVIWRAQLVAVVLLLPFAAYGATASTFGWSSLLAVVALGSLGTALAFFWFTTLIGRVGSTRASVTIYLVPVVAILLGRAAQRRDDPPRRAARHRAGARPAPTSPPSRSPRLDLLHALPERAQLAHLVAAEVREEAAAARRRGGSCARARTARAPRR